MVVYNRCILIGDRTAIPAIIVAKIDLFLQLEKNGLKKYYHPGGDDSYSIFAFYFFKMQIFAKIDFVKIVFLHFLQKLIAKKCHDSMAN